VSKLTAAAVEKILIDCLFNDEETAGGTPAEIVKVEGIVTEFGFHPGRLASHRDAIKALLDELPQPFQAATGGGWSFLNACVDKNGEQWGEHRNVEQLCALGIALGLAKWQFPRSMWPALPGGMPYFGVL